VDEAQFVGAVERRLRSSRFMILIIGDGIQEGVEALSSYLQLHAGLHVGLALIELSIWRGAQGGLIVVPRVPMRTLLIERGIVVVDASSNARIEAPQFQSTSRSISPRPMTASEPEFYEQLEERRPALALRLRSFLDALSAIGVTPGMTGKSMLMRWLTPDGAAASASTIDAGKTTCPERFGRVGHLGPARGAAWAGFQLDLAANANRGSKITRGAGPSAWVIPTDEELMIAREMRMMLGEIGSRAMA
jgi:hypothetical protein